MQATINTSLDVISVNVWAIIASLCNLLLIAWIVKKFLFKPVKKIMDTRRAAIDADYAQAAEFYAAGARHLTHLFNAMTPFAHRAPGVIGAAAERDDVTAELICDGLHVHPSAVRMAFRLFPGRICLISDALRCCGMPDGEYTLSGQKVVLSGGAARLADGTLAGSAVTLYDCMLLAIAFGVPEAEAIRAATLNPARILGCGERFGSIAPGKAADFVVCGKGLRLREVYIGGVRVETPKNGRF